MTGRALLAASIAAMLFAGCHTAPAPKPQGKAPPPVPAPVVAAPAVAPAPPAVPQGVMLGIDVLEADGFAELRGKRIALLTHPAGVDRRGVSTIEILRRAPNTRLVKLFATEHGLRGDLPASKTFPDEVDSETGLEVCSLYNGKTHRPTPAQLAGVDALVIDLQDIGVRSYTFSGTMKEAMEGCFALGVEVIVLDRPNPLGGLKVDGPLLDPEWMGPNLVNEFPVPYVHGLTMAELARLSVGTPGVLSDSARARAKLTVVAMRNWRRSMRWPDTGLAWVTTSPYIRDYAAVMGYAMVGLGCQIGGFRHGVGIEYPFRGISHLSEPLDVVERELRALNIPGIAFRRIEAPNAQTGKPGTGLYVDVTNWDAWRPTELSFYMMKLECKFDRRNPFAATSTGDANGFLRHMGSTEFFKDICARGSQVDVAAYIQKWQAQDREYQERSRRFWLYPM